MQWANNATVMSVTNKYVHTLVLWWASQTNIYRILNFWLQIKNEKPKCSLFTLLGHSHFLHGVFLVRSSLNLRWFYLSELGLRAPLTECPTGRGSIQILAMNEWMKEWMSEWKNERVNEWMANYGTKRKDTVTDPGYKNVHKRASYLESSILNRRGNL